MSELRPGYHQTDVGVSPNDWDVTTLGQIISLRRGHDLTERQRRPGSIPVFGSAGHNGFHDRALVDGPGIVLGRSGASYGQAHFCAESYWPHNTCLYATDFHGNDPKFLYYYLKRHDFSSHNSGGAQQSLNRNFISPVPVALPPLSEQQVIAEALGDADALIEGLEALIAKKRDIKQGAMQELLNGKQRGRPTRLGSVLQVGHGRSQKAVEVLDGPYPILASGGQIGTASDFLYNKASVLIGRKGTIDRPQFADKPFWTIDTLFYTVIAEPNDPKYLFYRFCMINWRQYNEASGVPSLSATTIENIEVEIHQPEEQRAIAAMLSDMDAEIVALEDKLVKASAVKQGMMQVLLTGEIRLI